MALVARVVVRHRTAIDPRVALVALVVVVALAIARVARSIARRIGRASISDAVSRRVRRRQCRMRATQTTRATREAWVTNGRVRARARGRGATRARCGNDDDDARREVDARGVSGRSMRSWRGVGTTSTSAGRARASSSGMSGGFARGARAPASASTSMEEMGDGDGLVPKPLGAAEALRRAAFPIFVAVLGAFSFGYHCGVVNPALEALSADVGIAGNLAAEGAVVSSMLFGAAVGSFAAGGFADKRGRKASLAIAGVVLAAGSALCAMATSLNGMLLGRLLVGLGVGLVSILVPMYVSELSPPAHRGILGSGPQLSIGCGILFAMLLGLPLQSADANPTWWRTMFWIACVPGALLAALANGIPESPSWLRSKGRFQEADAIESKQFGASAPVATDDASTVKVATWRETLQGRANRRAVITGPGLFFIQQFAGINAIIYFSTSIFQSAGIESGVAASVAVCVVNLVGSMIATSLLDKSGRKPLLMYSFLGMAFSCVGLAIAAAYPAAAMAPALSLFSVLSYVFIFGMGAGPVPGLLSSEIFAPAVRGKGMSLCFLAHWVFNFCIGQGFLPAVEYFGASFVYLVFGAFSLFGFLVTKGYVIETKGKSLEQISTELHI